MKKLVDISSLNHISLADLPDGYINGTFIDGALWILQKLDDLPVYENDLDTGDTQWVKRNFT